jgi:putative tryptophan/tyrosine transport system substrate-binding protein
MRERRAFLGAAASALIAASFATFAQEQPSNLRRIGFLGSESASNQAKRLEALRSGLRDLGYVEGKNIAIEIRWAEGHYDRLPSLAAELVDLKVSAIVASGTKALLALRSVTTTIPIVMGSTGDPIALGVVTNLARPGGNITGWTFFGTELSPKRLEMLKQALPGIARLALLVNPVEVPYGRSVTEAAANTLKLELARFEARDVGELENAFAAMSKRRVDAIVVQQNTMFAVNAGVIADLAIKHRLPSAGIVEFAEAGGMIGYGADPLEGHRRAAAYVDKILKGARAGDLAIEQATTFQLVINLKTAKALGIAIPQSLVLRADAVIQ